MEYEKVLLDLMERVIKLEKEVEELKENNKKEDYFSSSSFDTSDFDSFNYSSNKGGEIKTTRDKTRYMFNGQIYLKNKLVLAIVSDYVQKHFKISSEELKQVFNKSLQGSIGVVENENIARQRKDYEVRFFAKEDEILHLVDGNVVVCSQWGILNIPNFIVRARQLGYEIEEI